MKSREPYRRAVAWNALRAAAVTRAARRAHRDAIESPVPAGVDVAEIEDISALGARFGAAVSRRGVLHLEPWALRW